ncbi:SIMPL domain-containing protein [Thermodesulfobacteriota bacterium]
MFNRVLTITVIMTGCFLSSLYAGEAPQPRSIKVMGEAQVRVAPDEVIITMGMESWDRQLAAAKSKNDRRVKKVMQSIRKVGVKENQIQTSFIEVEPRYESNYEKRSFIGYFVKNTIAVKLTEISKFEELLSNVLESGANYVYGIRFLTSELRKHRDKARSLAIKAAKEKASDLAGELDQKLGKPLRIEEVPVGWWSSYRMGRMGQRMSQNVYREAPGGGGTASEGLAPGRIGVNAKVNVTFELE